jgi:hypothetical protein
LGTRNTPLSSRWAGPLRDAGATLLRQRQQRGLHALSLSRKEGISTATAGGDDDGNDDGDGWERKW